jgi:molecular chaperone DnaJ
VTGVSHTVLTWLEQYFVCVSVVVLVCCRTVTVPTIDGKAELVVPPLTLSGEVLQMRGKGVKNPRTAQRGSQLVTIR